MDHTTEYKTARLVDSQIKKAGKAELLPSWPQFLDLCRQAVERYNHSPHSALPKVVDESGRRRHMTPMEAWAGHLARGWVPPTMSQVELDDCFRPRLQVTTRRGLVRLFGNVYFHKELEHHGGEQVFVEYAVQDGSRVWVRDGQERLICIAGFEANKSAMFPVSAVEKAAADREARRLAVVDRKREEIIEERRGVIDYTPAPPQIEAARAALVVEMAQPAPAANVVDGPTDSLGRWRRYTALKQRDHLSAEEQAWVARYERSSDFAAFAAVEQDLAIGGFAAK
jgi:putative transposase